MTRKRAAASPATRTRFQAGCVAVAAVLLAVGALGLLAWAFATRSPSRLAWQTSIATVLSVVLPELDNVRSAAYLAGPSPQNCYRSPHGAGQAA